MADAKISRLGQWEIVQGITCPFDGIWLELAFGVHFVKFKVCNGKSECNKSKRHLCLDLISAKEQRT